MSKLDPWEVPLHHPIVPEPEPNWRSMYEEVKKALDELRKAYDDLEDMYVELQERDE